MEKKDIDEARFQQDIKKAREERGLSQEKCAKEFQKHMLARYGANIRVSQVAWTQYETGERFPNIERFYEICAFMKLKPRDYMLNLTFAQGEMGAFDKAAFRAALLDTRREHNLTQKQAADQSDIPPAVYERVEKTGIANLHNFIRLCEAFALDPNDYLYLKE